jgi:phage gp45-like
MKLPNYIVKDSSVWQTASHSEAISRKDPYIRIGIVKSVFVDKNTNELRYLVEVRDTNDAIEVNARMMRRMGGVYNYEDIVHRGYKINDKPDEVNDFSAKAGDAVIVCFLNGNGREALILGGFHHPARKTNLKAEDGPQYESEFNGILTQINKDGEYTVTFRGQPTNLSKLSDKPSKIIDKAKYNESVGTSFYKFDKTGSFEISDNDKKAKQNFRIDKKTGFIELNSGKVQMKFTKDGEKVYLKCKDLQVVSDDKIKYATKEYELNASKTTKIKSPKIAIGQGGVELLDLVSQLAAIVKDIATQNSSEIHPTGVGPSGPPTNAGAYSSAASKAGQVKGKVDSIKGSL